MSDPNYDGPVPIEVYLASEAEVERLRAALIEAGKQALGSERGRTRLGPTQRVGSGRADGQGPLDMTPIEFAGSLISYCFATGASVTSWGRTAKQNGKVGGHENSWHLVFMGADVVYDVKPSLQRAKMLASRFGLIVVREIDHDHLQPPGAQAQNPEPIQV